MGPASSGIDSGATYSIFHPKEISQAGLNYQEGKPRKIIVGNGAFIDVYFFSLPAQIGGEAFTAEIGFSEHLTVGFNLIGRKDVFEKFRVCFSDAERKITFQVLNLVS